MSLSDIEPSTSRGRGQGHGPICQGKDDGDLETKTKIKLDLPVKRISKKSVFSSSSSSTSSSSVSSKSRSRSSKSTSMLSRNEIWFRVHRRVCSYLKENRLYGYVKDVCKKRSTMAEKLLHALLTSLSSSTASSPNSTRGVQGQEVDVEMDILFKLLGMMKEGKGKSDKHSQIRSDERTLLLKLVVWALHAWKKVALALITSKDRKEFVFQFENCFLETLNQIRIESALSSKVDPSKKCLQLLSLLKKVHKLWVGLEIASESLNGENPIVDSVEEKIVKDVEEKSNLPIGCKDDLLFFNRFDGMRERLGQVCSEANGGRETKTSRSKIAIQGMLINEMVQLFCESVKTDPNHRDHCFLNQLLHGTAMSSKDYKRALVWVILKILPSLKEKSCGLVRLIITSQGLIRNTLQNANTEIKREEASTWKQILQRNLSTDDLALFYSIVLPKRIMNRFPRTEKTFGDFYSTGKSNEVIIGSETETKNQRPREGVELVVSFMTEEESDSSDPWEIKATVDWDMVPEK